MILCLIKFNRCCFKGNEGRNGSIDGRKKLERNLDNLLRVSHSIEVPFFAILSYFALQLRH